MRLFLQQQDTIRIINGIREWSGTLTEFQTLEPDYPGLPTLTQAPALVRYQTPEWKYLEDANTTRHPDNFDALPYCDRLATYVITQPTIWVHATLAKTLLCASNPADTIPFTADLRLGPTVETLRLPIAATWPIMLRQKNGLAMDNILVTFVDGHFAGAYTYNASLPLGEWYIDAQDFATVAFGGQTYQVQLAQPVRFTIYRQL